MNSTIIYILLSSFYLLLSLLYLQNRFRKKTIIVFLISIFLFPSTPFFIQFYFKNQVYAWDYFIIGPLLLYTSKMIILKSAKVKSFQIISAMLIFSSLFFLYHILLGDPEIIHILIDFKIVVLLLFGVAFNATSNTYIDSFFDSRIWKEALRINFFLDTLLFVINYKFSLAFLITKDSHYLNDVARYSDLSIPFIIAFLIYKVVSKQRFSFAELVFVFAPILYSGNRTLLLGTLIIMLFYLFQLNIKRLLTYSLFFISLAFLLGLFILNAKEDSTLSRIKLLTNPELIVDRLKTRIEPLTIEVEQWDSPIYWILGKGFGKSIYIPWFEYRKNINNNNAYMDNIYFTLFIKFGLISFFIYLFLYNYFLFLSHNKMFTFVMMVFLLFMGITTAFMYQSSFFVFLISPSLICQTKK